MTNPEIMFVSLGFSAYAKIFHFNFTKISVSVLCFGHLPMFTDCVYTHQRSEHIVLCEAVMRHLQLALTGIYIYLDNMSGQTLHFDTRCK